MVLIAGSWTAFVEAKPVPIGVGVHLTRTVTDPWTRPQADEVKSAIADDLLRRLQRFVHWDFALEDPALHRAVLRFAVRDGGPNEVLVGIELLLRPKGGTEGATSGPPVSLVRKKWFEPGDGLPSHSRARSELLTMLDEFLPEVEPAVGPRGLGEVELRDRVPIAEAPRWLDPTQRSLVLPLSRARYGHLFEAVFVIHCRSQRDQTTRRWTAAARGIWSVYDPSLPEALDAFVLDPIPDADVREAEPTAVFLKDYQPPGWET
jgi:hypothetical protein